MATTATFKELLEYLSERSRFGDVMGTVTGITTGWSGATSYLKGPFPGQRWPRGSPLLTTAGTAINEATYVDQYTASTGAGTIEPDASTTWTNGIIWPYGQGVTHPDDVKDCINRALALNCCRWQRQPLTYVPDGDYLGTVASFWTASAGTQTYVDSAYPETVGRCLNITHSSTANSTGNTIPAVAAEVWRFETAIRATTDGDTAAFTVRDVLAGSDISLTFQEGDGTTTSRAFVKQKGHFTVPGTEDTDARIAPRLTVSGSGTMAAQMAPIIMYPQSAMRFPVQQRVVRADRIGNFVYARSAGGFAGPERGGYTPPITIGGRSAGVTQEADHFVVSFNFIPVEPVYYDELVFGSELSAMTDTTTFEKEYVIKYALVYLYEMLARHDKEKWVSNLNSAKSAARIFDYHNVPSKTVVGRV